MNKGTRRCRRCFPQRTQLELCYTSPNPIFRWKGQSEVTPFCNVRRWKHCCFFPCYWSPCSPPFCVQSTSVYLASTLLAICSSQSLVEWKATRLWATSRLEDPHHMPACHLEMAHIEPHVFTNKPEVKTLCFGSLHAPYNPLASPWVCEAEAAVAV